MTTTPGPATSTDILDRAIRTLDRLERNSGEVVGTEQLKRAESRSRHSVYVAVAAMSLITILAVMMTVSLLRVPGPAGVNAPVPVSAQFVRGDSGCTYRVFYKAADGAMSSVDAQAAPGACG